jgi:hypothetical protein
MRRIFFAGLVCLLVAASASAQSTQCSTTAPTSGTVTVGQSFTIGWCSVPQDVNGTPVTITGFNVYRNGVALVGGSIITDSPNAAGASYSHVGSQPETIVGTVQYQVTALDLSGESGKSAPFTLNVTSIPPGLPKTPTGLRIVVP